MANYFDHMLMIVAIMLLLLQQAVTIAILLD